MMTNKTSAIHFSSRSNEWATPQGLFDRLSKGEPDDKPVDWDIPIYKLAEKLRKDKEDGMFETYKQAYEWGAKQCTIKGQPITAQQLENNYYKANSAGYFDPPD